MLSVGCFIDFEVDFQSYNIKKNLLIKKIIVRGNFRDIFK